MGQKYDKRHPVTRVPNADNGVALPLSADADLADLQDCDADLFSAGNCR